VNLAHNSEPINFAVPMNARSQLHAALKELRPLQRIVLHLRFWENREIAEIARLTRMRWSDIDHLIESTLTELRPMLGKAETKRPETYVA